MKNILPTGNEKSFLLFSIWSNEHMQSFRHFLNCYNYKDFVLTPEEILKMLEFYHNKGSDMWKLRCTLPKSVSICLHESTKFKFCPFTDTDKHLLPKNRKIFSAVFQWSLLVKLYWIKFLNGSQQICASPLLVLMLVSSMPNRCVN